MVKLTLCGALIWARRAVCRRVNYPERSVIEWHSLSGFLFCCQCPFSFSLLPCYFLSLTMFPFSPSLSFTYYVLSSCVCLAFQVPSIDELALRSWNAPQSVALLAPFHIVLQLDNNRSVSLDHQYFALLIFYPFLSITFCISLFFFFFFLPSFSLSITLFLSFFFSPPSLFISLCFLFSPCSLLQPLYVAIENSQCDSTQ